MTTVFDLAIIGGGINGSGIARDAAGRGLSVLLCEADDLASGTSSRSTKLIHGGLRYLEQFEFRLVRELLIEREVLWGIAPHLVHPMRFVLPYGKGMRPAWMLRVGLFLYDHLGGRERLPGTRVVELAEDEAGRPLRLGAFEQAFEYSDCTVDDARLVVLNARDAADRGADIRTRTRVLEAHVADGCWQLALQSSEGGNVQSARARVLVNAAGPWVEEVLTQTLHAKARVTLRLVQGSHIVVPKLFAHDRAYLLQNADGRVVFAIPYEGDYTLIGTTERDVASASLDARASQEEIAYLCRTASAFFRQPVEPGSIVWSYAGVRPLHDEGTGEAKAASRDYVLELSDTPGAPLLSVIGGKITTYRKLAEAALERLQPRLPAACGLEAGWTGRTALPGGDFAIDGLEALAEELRRTHPFLSQADSVRLARAYGTQAPRILGAAKSWTDLGCSFGAALSEAEVRHLVTHEWARSADDILWRRTKLGLRFTPAQVAALDEFMRHLAPANSCPS